ncbi:hypothetical protein [Streptomyces sp. CC208A]|uniref:hypothetical protein n=1 Tax=Streptomyces sp. CC208A TaxID=3044573 RepID=UPI0024A9AC64|nr:hypothetical protein [Streptomyces sp. CC208A]
MTVTVTMFRLGAPASRIPHREIRVRGRAGLWQTASVLATTMIIGSGAPVRSDR